MKRPEIKFDLFVLLEDIEGMSSTDLNIGRLFLICEKPRPDKNGADVRVTMLGHDILHIVKLLQTIMLQNEDVAGIITMATMAYMQERDSKKKP